MTLQLGQAFQLLVTVNNAAHVQVPLGADELDYTLTASGGLSGVFAGTDAALGNNIEHFVTLDTTTVGIKSGLITISSSSPGVKNGYVEIPISFNVTALENGDFNRDAQSMLPTMLSGAMAMQGRRIMKSGELTLAKFRPIRLAWRVSMIPEPHAVLTAVLGLLGVNAFPVSLTRVLQIRLPRSRLTTRQLLTRSLRRLWFLCL